MLNSVLLQLVLAGNVNAPLLLDLDGATSTTRWKSVTALPDADSLFESYTRKGIRKPDPKPGQDDPRDNNDLKKQSPNGGPLDKKRVSDLSPPETNPLLGGWLQTGNDTTVLLADRESSLHPEQDRDSPSYSGRKASGPDHGDDPHGGDLHNEVHDIKLPANYGKDDSHPMGKHYPTRDPYGDTVPD